MDQDSLDVNDFVSSVKAEAGAQKTAKRASRSWKPASAQGDVLNKEPGFRYRRVAKDDENIARKLQEGWEFDAKTEVASDTAKRVSDGRRTSSVREGSDFVVMRLPEGQAQERDKYYAEKSQRQMLSIKERTQSALSGIAGGLVGRPNVHGRITVIE